MADIFAVIADPTRRELLRVLVERRDSTLDSGEARASFAAGATGVGEISVGDLVIELGLSQPTVSKHLRVLRDTGLVHVREKGQHRYYSLETAPLRDVEVWLAGFLGPLVDTRVAEAGAGATGADLEPGAAHPDLPASARPGSARPGSARPVPAPLRRAAENLPDAKDVGATLGRAVAQAQSRATSVVKKRLGRRDQ